MEFCYKKKQRMNDVLICCGYSYNLKTVSKAINQITKEPLTQRWICSVRDCYSTVSVENNAIIKIDGKKMDISIENLLATHKYEAKSPTQLIALETLSNLKSKVIENPSTSIGKTSSF